MERIMGGAVTLGIFCLFLFGVVIFVSDFLETIGSKTRGSEEPKVTYDYGIITEKYYIDGVSQTTVGAGANITGITDGKPAVGVIPYVGSTSSKDKFILFINGIKHELTNELWAKAEINDTIKITKNSWGTIKDIEVMEQGIDKVGTGNSTEEEEKVEELTEAEKKQKEIEELKKKVEEMEKEINNK